MPRRPCIEAPCPRLAEPGKARCAGHEAEQQAAKWLRNANRDPEYRKLRATVAESLPVRCAICGDWITHIGHGSTALTLDHIVSAANGGGNAPENLRPTHKRCNSKRGRGDHGG